MTKKQKRFVEEYLIDLNATQAAIRAGYSPSSARQIADKNMSKHDIQAAIDRAMAERSKRTGANQDRVIQELAKIAFLNPADIINFDEATVKDTATRDDLSCVQVVKMKAIPTKSGEVGTEREIRTYDKIKALELLGKHLGMFTDKVKFEAPLPVVICDDMDDE